MQVCDTAVIILPNIRGLISQKLFVKVTDFLSESSFVHLKQNFEAYI